MEFAPREIIKGKNADGTTTRLEVWDFGSLATLELIPFIISIIAVALLSSISSIVLIGFCLFGLNNKLFNVLGVIVGAYFLYDCEHGWVVMTITSFCLGDSIVNLLYGLTIGSMIAHVGMLIFGEKLNMLITGILIFVGFVIGNGVHEKGWVKKNRAVKKEVEVSDTRTPEQMEADYQAQVKKERDQYDELGNAKKDLEE